ncbi:TPA: phage tail protein, partial [Escherichia coli]
MTAKYFAILTNQGAARLANAATLGTKLNLTQMAVGDANGTLPTPDPTQTKLINQKRIAPLNLLTVDPANTSQIIAEQIIPENEGGFWIREIGLYDDAGVLIAVANCPETYKPQLQEGSGRTQTIRMILIVSSTSAITLKIDPSVVLATRQYVDDKVIEVKAYADNLLAAHLAAANPHPQYLQVADIAKYTPVGVPLPFPSATPPTGWLKCNGAAFDKAKYPGLAAVFPSGYLPDLRG